MPSTIETITLTTKQICSILPPSCHLPVRVGGHGQAENPPRNGPLRLEQPTAPEADPGHPVPLAARPVASRHPRPRRPAPPPSCPTLRNALPSLTLGGGAGGEGPFRRSP